MSLKSLQSNKILKPTTIPTIPPSSTVALNTAKCLKIILVMVICLYFVILFKAFEDMKYKNRNESDRSTNTRKPIFEYTEKMYITAENEFSERRQILWDTCLKRKIVGKYPPNAWEFFISPRHGITWCNVFKAASSTWLYYFNILGGYHIRQLQNSSRTPLELARQIYARPNTKELSEALTNSLSFLVVREPFERLVSAYKNKLEGDRRKFYSDLGKQIVNKFRNISYYDDKRNLRGPTFREFLLYLVDLHKNGEHFDEHWSPVHKFCTPCSINFTLVAKLETFQRDTEYIIRQAGLETLLLNKITQFEIDKIRNRSSKNDTKSLVPLYFAQIGENLLRDVLEIYELDFELFGYNSTKYFEYVHLAPPPTSPPPSSSSSSTSMVLNLFILAAHQIFYNFFVTPMF